MPTLAEMLTPDAIERLKAVPTPSPVVGDVEHARACNCLRRNDGVRRDGDVMVHKACGRPLPKTAMLAGVTAVPVTMPCAGGCGVTVTVAARPHAPSLPRAVVCRTCAVQMSQGSTVTTIDPTPEKETPMTVNLDLIPSAQLGETIKKAERERLAAGLPKKRKKAKAKADKAEKAQVKATKEQRKVLTRLGVLPGFTLRGVEVPALDASAIANLDEMPAAKTRSPYNKARYRLGEALLPTTDEPGIGVVATTWHLIVTEHQRLAHLAAQESTPKAAAKPKKEGKKKQAHIAAAIDLEERQVAAIMTATGCSEKKARKVLVSL